MGKEDPPGDVGDGDHAVSRGKLSFVVRSAASLATSTVVTAGIGFIYWALAARTFPVTAVGESSTAISAVSLLAPLSIVGLGTLMMVRLPGMQTGRSALVSTATLVAGLTAGLIALGCALVLPGSFLGLPGVGQRPIATAIFVALVVSQAICLVIDQAFLAVSGSGVQLSRNLIQSITKLALLAVLAATMARFGSLAIVTSWLVANVISIVAVVIMLGRRYRVSLRSALPRLSALRGVHFAAATHHGLNTSLFVPYFAMPIVANVMLGSEQAAYLYATWSLAGFVFFLPMALAWALFASGARDSRTFVTEFRFTLRVSLLICTAAVVAIVLLGGLVLRIFGEAYAENGHMVLIVLAMGGLGTVIRDHHVTLARVVGDEGREALLIAVLGVGEIAGAAIGAHLGGLIGLSLGWLAAIGVEVLVCGPLVWRTYRGRVAVPVRVAAGPQTGGAA
jgi:O-antigen/teichoic acid export membrane protein